AHAQHRARPKTPDEPCGVTHRLRRDERAADCPRGAASLHGLDLEQLERIAVLGHDVRLETPRRAGEHHLDVGELAERVGNRKAGEHVTAGPPSRNQDRLHFAPPPSATSASARSSSPSVTSAGGGVVGSGAGAGAPWREMLRSTPAAAALTS